MHHTRESEPALHDAQVVSIFKKGDPSRLENYRPISLLQSFYKLIGTLIKSRLAKGFDDWICNTQYGFRSSKSTSHAIFLARGLQDIAEKDGSNIAIILFDWEKAFDKIDHVRLLEALYRIGVPSQLLCLILKISARVHGSRSVTAKENQISIPRKQELDKDAAPIITYLFMLVMSVIFQDIKS